ncbi:MAG: hypothetical protein WC866_05915 [Patescibacteria group bacterium]
MSPRPQPPLSVWLLQLVVPLWLLATCVVLSRWMPEDTTVPSQGNDRGGIVLFAFFCMLQMFGWISAIDRFDGKRWSILFLFVGIILPTFSIVFFHRNDFAETAAWYEVAFMAFLAIWAASSACLTLVWTGIVIHDLRAYWAVPISLGTVLLAFVAFFHFNDLLLDAITLYSLPILYVAGRDYLRG